MSHVRAVAGSIEPFSPACAVGEVSLPRLWMFAWDTITGTTLQPRGTKTVTIFASFEKSGGLD